MRTKITFVNFENEKKPRVLVVGIYLADRVNTVTHLVSRFGQSTRCEVTQAWACMLTAQIPPSLSAVTVISFPEGKPKFPALNLIISKFDLDNFDYIIVCDDDIVLPFAFLDNYVAAQALAGFALAQPSRTRSSCGNKQITVKQTHSFARQTRFVEIGPLFSIDARLYSSLLPFDENNPMGWGVDYHWPVVVEKLGLIMGIIDHATVDHSIRALASGYSGQLAKNTMEEWLSKHPHLSKSDAEITVRSVVPGTANCMYD